MERVDYNTLVSKICESDRFGKCMNEHSAIARYLESRKEPVIIENGPVHQWNLFKEMSWKYLKMNLPETLEGIRFTKSRFNLYRTYTPQEELKEIAAKDFLDLLSKIDSDITSDLDHLFPYFTAQIPEDIVFKHRMQLDLLNASVCRIIAGGDRHCGGHPSRSMQDGHSSANIHMWIGAKNVTARFHYDHAENTFVQFLGRKHFFLAPPSQASKFYLFPAASNYHRQSQIVDVYDMATIESDFPQFLNVSGLQETVVKPGDMLYIPIFWMHSVTSLESSLALSFWPFPLLYKAK